jgi:hypothetical protein
MTMTDSRNRRWYQFSLRMLLAIVTVSALGLAWWRHRSDCLERSRFHAEQNLARAREISGVEVADRPTYLGKFGCRDSDTTYFLAHEHTTSGFYVVVLDVSHGKLPEREERLQTELTREAELVDQYYHAIWRPWERLWIDEAP